MNVLARPEVVSALVVLILAWMGVLTALAPYALARLRKAEGDINGVGRKTDEVSKAVGGGSGAIGAPTWLQGEDRLPSGQRPQLWGQECGEECVSMVVQALHGVPTVADVLRVLYRGPNGGALTGPADIVALLALCNVRAVSRSIPASDLPGTVNATVARGRFMICLGYWVSTSYLHWVLVSNASENGWTAHDPIRGLVNDAWTWVTPRYNGVVVEVTQGRDKP